jgi:hypothetical protein
MTDMIMTGIGSLHLRHQIVATRIRGIATILLRHRDSRSRRLTVKSRLFGLHFVRRPHPTLEDVDFEPGSRGVRMTIKKKLAAILLASVATLGASGCYHHHHYDHDHYPPPPPPGHPY